MDKIEHLRTRQACKLFDFTKRIDDSTMLQIYEAFNLTPTSYGLQPVHMVVIEKFDIKIQLQEYAYNQEQVGTASHVLILCVQKNIDVKFIDSHQELINEYVKNAELPKHIVVDRLLSHLDPIKLNIKSWTDNQAYIALGNLINTLAILGIDACPMEGFDKSLVDSYLKLDDQNLRSVIMLPIGISSKMEQVRLKSRKKISEVIHFYPSHNK